MSVLLSLVALLQASDFEALRSKLEELKNAPTSQRQPTVTAIGALKSPEAATFLSTLFDQEKEAAYRCHILESFAPCGLERTAQKLLAVVGDANLPFILRSTALRLLTDAKAKEGLEAIKTVVAAKLIPYDLRLQAYASLLRYPVAQTEALWREALKDVDPIIRGEALYGLAPLKDLKLQDFARQALANTAEEAAVKYGSVEVLRFAPGVFTTKLFLTAAATPDSTLRRLLSDALSTFSEEKPVEAIYAALRNPDPMVRSVAARALGRLKHPQALSRLSEPLKDKNPEVHLAALEAVAERHEKGCEEILIREAQRTDEEAAGAAIALLHHYPSDTTQQLLVKLAGHHKPGIAIPAIEALGELRLPESLAALEKPLQAKEWPIRCATIRALGKLKTKEAIDLLVDRMSKEEGRLLAECGDALRAATGKGLGYAPGSWKEWWGASRESFAFPSESAPNGPAAHMTTYYGVPVLSNRMVFCLDISGSMSEKLGDATRLELAKKELTHVLASLGKDALVNLIFFDDRIEPMQKQLWPVKNNLAKANQMIAALQPRGRTNFYDTLEFAFQHKEADTIYLVSDGEPTDGKIILPEDILREVRRMNRTRQIVIHTISIGVSPFMKALAEQNGGQYVEVK